MYKLSLEQMENVNGGWENAFNCLAGIGSMVFAIAITAVAGAATGGVVALGVASFVFGWLGGGVTDALGCGRWLTEGA
ncbi:MAG: hypothetical protein LBG92_05635 [Prevotellaceae bacterium]|jgi:hypothetical protein|nr:hypothetical protein [Prevotellaceae bacterium]